MDFVKVGKNTISLNLFSNDGDSLDQNVIRHKAINFLNNQDFPEGTLLTIVVTHDPRNMSKVGCGGRASSSNADREMKKP